MKRAISNDTNNDAFAINNNGSQNSTAKFANSEYKNMNIP